MLFYLWKLFNARHAVLNYSSAPLTVLNWAPDALLGLKPSRIIHLIYFIERHAVKIYSSAPLDAVLNLAPDALLRLKPSHIIHLIDFYCASRRFKLFIRTACGA